MGGDVVQGWLAREWAQGPRDGDPESSLALRHARTRCGDQTPASQQGVPTRRRVRQGLAGTHSLQNWDKSVGQKVTCLQIDSKILFAICTWRIIHVFPQMLVFTARCAREQAGGGA